MMINISKHSYVRAIVRTDIKSTNKYGGINGVPHVYPVFSHGDRPHRDEPFRTAYPGI